MRLRFRIRVSPDRSPASVAAGGAIDRVVDVEEASEIRLGRREGLEVELPFPAVSALHARLVRRSGGWHVEDLGSANGTFLAGVKLPARVPRPLSAGAELRLGNVTLALEDGGRGAGHGAGARRGDAGGSAHAQGTATIARRLVNDLFRGGGGAAVARLEVVGGPSAGQALALAVPDRLYKIGRAPSCDLMLADEDVSREHAGVQRRWEGVFVHDLGSKNGVELGGQRVEGEQRLGDRAEIRVGRSRLRLDDPEDRYLSEMRRDEAAKRGIGAEEKGEARSVEGAEEGAGAAARGEARPEPGAQSESGSGTGSGTSSGSAMTSEARPVEPDVEAGAGVAGAEEGAGAAVAPKVEPNVEAKVEGVAGPAAKADADAASSKLGAKGEAPARGRGIAGVALVAAGALLLVVSAVVWLLLGK